MKSPHRKLEIQKQVKGVDHHEEVHVHQEQCNVKEEVLVALQANDAQQTHYQQEQLPPQPRGNQLGPLLSAHPLWRQHRSRSYLASAMDHQSSQDEVDEHDEDWDDDIHACCAKKNNVFSIELNCKHHKMD
ncbi:hypothetical protein E2C01_024478 [Portunus trituberculatus]|uniref:Uncharacterized protein n=1 Tax=Portunus trituberculatus TaxID=210409 RepID=A0A5B7ECT7_PORTR|nr:hypothetical protein [Portunus trituberculatus]